MQRFSSYGDGSNIATKYTSTITPSKSYGFDLINSSSYSDSLSFTPSPSSSIEDNNASIAEDRLKYARLNLQYQELVDRYGRCIVHLQDAAKESENLRQENLRLRIAYKDLTNRLGLLTGIAIQNRFLSSSPDYPSLSRINDLRNIPVGDNGRVNSSSNSNSNYHVLSNVSDSDSPTSVIESNNRVDKKSGVERVTLPKSISIRSSGYLKANQPAVGGTGSTTNRFRSASPVKNNSQRVFVPGGNKEQEAVEFDVFNQGTSKTEICNKWQETGACPYGDHCQFAHGVNELRPVIRHPRYKTEVCRMVLAGEICPYGHRCHFRHALTEQEKKLRGAAK
ncbi:hypothetical protein ACHQM5_009617 [Ranunculus cassubicifolius]